MNSQNPINVIRSRWYDLDSSTRNYITIAGIVVGSAALLTYPAILLYRKLRNRKNSPMQEDNQHEENVHDVKSFAPTYRGKKHTPHHRKVEANGHSNG